MSNAAMRRVLIIRASSWNLGRWARDAALIGFVDRDVIRFEGSAGGPVQRKFGFRVCSLRRDFGGTSLRQKALELNDLKIGRQANFEFLLLHVDGLLLQDTALNGGFVRGARLLERHLGICYLEACLILQLLTPDLRLPQLQLIAYGVGLRHAIPQRQRYLQADAIRRKVPPEDLAERRAIATHAGSIGERPVEQIRVSGEPAVLHGSDQVDLRTQRD